MDGGGILQLDRLRVRTKTRETLVSDLQYAGDEEQVTHSSEAPQISLDAYAAANSKVGLNVNIGTTEVMRGGAGGDDRSMFSVSR